jgi:hypothetical protein
MDRDWAYAIYFARFPVPFDPRRSLKMASGLAAPVDASRTVRMLLSDIPDRRLSSAR